MSNGDERIRSKCAARDGLTNAWRTAVENFVPCRASVQKEETAVGLARRGYRYWLVLAGLELWLGALVSIEGGSSDEPGSMSLSALPGCGRGVSSSTTRQCCTVDPCPCSSGLRRTDQDQGRVSKSPGAGESETASQQLLEPFAEGRPKNGTATSSKPGFRPLSWLTRMRNTH
jgi:hypothetical protein